MLRSDYDNHPLWETLRNVDATLDRIVEDHQPDELPYVERIRVQQAYVRSFDVVASTRVAFFHPEMLSRVNTIWADVAGNLDNRVANGVGQIGYLATAADRSEAALMEMGAWPRQYGKGGEVTQMNTLFEDLLETQRTSIAALSARHAELLEQVAEYEARVAEKGDETATRIESVQTEVARLEGQIEADKTAVAEAVSASAKAVSDLSAVNDESFDKWKEGREKTFKSEFDPLRTELGQRLSEANEDYADLLATKESYQKLVSAIAADEVASQFQSEARWGRIAGVALYVVGFLLLGGAAVPLLFLLFEHTGQTPEGGVNWSAIIIRVAIGILAGSAATVAIRLGARLINNANAIKRMELELRAIGPFLANVAEPAKIDDARIELVSRAFGKAYAEGSGGKAASSDDSKDDAIPVSTLSQVADIVQRFIKT